jgi:DNA polymerase III alpha subunit
VGVNGLAVHLCAHSDYSLLESVLTVEGLVKQGAKLGFTALALTDHNSTGGHWEFQRYCREEGIKPIFGLELDVNYDSDSQW